MTSANGRRGQHSSINAFRTVAGGSLAAALLCGLLALAAPARAEDGDDYRSVVKLALGELELGNYVEANAQFERAHALSPSARTLRGLGIVAFELKHYAEAEAFLSDALSDTRRALDGELRSQTESLLQRTRRYLGTLHLDGVPADARLLIDDQHVQLRKDALYRLSLGDHTLNVRADGKAPARRRFRVRSGQTTELELDLSASAGGPATAPSGPAMDLTKTTDEAIAAEQDDGSVLESPWLWTAVGVVVAGATVGTIVALSGTESNPETPYGGSTGATLTGP